MVGVEDMGEALQWLPRWTVLGGVLDKKNWLGWLRCDGKRKEMKINSWASVKSQASPIPPEKPRS